MNGYFGIGGFMVSCVANRVGALADFSLSKSNADEKKAAFDYLKAHQNEIDDALGGPPSWYRTDDNKSSWISSSLSGVSNVYEADWPTKAKFNAERKARIMKGHSVSCFRDAIGCPWKHGLISEFRLSTEE